MKRIFLTTTAALILTACSQNNKFYTPGTGSQPVQPIVPVQLPNPLDLPGKNQPGYVNPYPAGTHEHFAAQPAYPLTLEHWANDALLHQVTRANSKLVVCNPSSAHDST